MHIRIIGLLACTVALCAACSPGPGSAEWCKGVIQGTIQASQAELEANSEKCEQELMKQILGGKAPGG
jgi:hypothetical protein